MSDHIIDIVKNKKAKFEYEILDTFEAGIVLYGTEVKSIRKKKVSINEAYAKVKGNEIFITGLNISPYEMGSFSNHEPLRERKLLLHRHEIKRLIGKVNERGFTIVPLKLYIKNGKVKVEIALARGKAEYDKKRTIQKRDLDREMQREIKRHL